MIVKIFQIRFCVSFLQRSLHFPIRVFLFFSILRHFSFHKVVSICLLNSVISPHGKGKYQSMNKIKIEIERENFYQKMKRSLDEKHK